MARRPCGARASGREIGWSFLIALPALALPFVIRSSVIEGVATATEVSTIGIVYSLIMGLLVYRQFEWSRIGPMLVQTASLSGAILIIVGAATAMAWAITQSGFSQNLAQAIAQVPGGRWSFIVLSILVFIVLGSVLEGLPAIVLFGPLMFPIARDVGVHEVHYAMIAILAMGVGLFAPPFGIGYYVVLRDRRLRAGPRAAAHLDLSRGADDRPRRGRGGAVDFDRISMKPGSALDKPEEWPCGRRKTDAAHAHRLDGGNRRARRLLPRTAHAAEFEYKMGHSTPRGASVPQALRWRSPSASARRPAGA